MTAGTRPSLPRLPASHDAGAGSVSALRQVSGAAGGAPNAQQEEPLPPLSPIAKERAGARLALHGAAATTGCLPVLREGLDESEILFPAKVLTEGCLLAPISRGEAMALEAARNRPLRKVLHGVEGEDSLDSEEFQRRLGLKVVAPSTPPTPPGGRTLRSYEQRAVRLATCQDFPEHLVHKLSRPSAAEDADAAAAEGGQAGAAPAEPARRAFIGLDKKAEGRYWLMDEAPAGSRRFGGEAAGRFAYKARKPLPKKTNLQHAFAAATCGDLPDTVDWSAPLTVGSDDGSDMATLLSRDST